MSTFPLVPYTPFAPATIEKARTVNQNLGVVSKTGLDIHTPQKVRPSVSVNPGFRPAPSVESYGFRLKKGSFIDIYM
jgi:hypothetical protein